MSSFKWPSGDKFFRQSMLGLLTLCLAVGVIIFSVTFICFVWQHLGLLTLLIPLGVVVALAISYVVGNAMLEVHQCPRCNKEVHGDVWYYFHKKKCLPYQVGRV